MTISSMAIITVSFTQRANEPSELAQLFSRSLGSLQPRNTLESSRQKVIISANADGGDVGRV